MFAFLRQPSPHFLLRAMIRAARGAGATVCCICTISLLAGCSHLPSAPRSPLPPGVAGERLALDSPVGPLALYAGTRAGEADSRPLLLLHSVNAAGSSYEVKPLYEHYDRTRPVYALDLPGFATSARDERVYTAQLMSDAVASATRVIAARHGDMPIDALALSLSSEFLARSASEHPHAYHSVALLSPTGFQRGAPFVAAPGTHRGKRWLHWMLETPPWRQGLFNLLTSERSMRYFLAKTWGSPDIDEGLLRYDRLSATQAGARHAPYSFVSGFLFSADITRVYESLTVPVWMAHGTRGDFVDYRDRPRFEGRRNWTFAVFDTGALPHFEQLNAVTTAYDEFLAAIPSP